MNSMIVHILQLCLIFLIWRVAIEDPNFKIFIPESIDILCTRFLASMLMHFNVEKDIRNGISMMKYAVNHYNNFENIHAAFLISFMLAFNSFLVEITVVMVLTSIESVLEVIMKYVSLSAVANIPRFYFNSLIDHKLLKVSTHTVEITEHRRKKLMVKRPWFIKVYRAIQKALRLFFCSWSYYFLPFTTLIITYV